MKKNKLKISKSVTPILHGAVRENREMSGNFTVGQEKIKCK